MGLDTYYKFSLGNLYCQRISIVISHKLGKAQISINKKGFKTVSDIKLMLEKIDIIVKLVAKIVKLSNKFSK